MIPENERHTSSFLHKCFCPFYMKCTSQCRYKILYTYLEWVTEDCLHIYVNTFETKLVSLNSVCALVPKVTAVSPKSAYVWSMTLHWCCAKLQFWMISLCVKECYVYCLCIFYLITHCRTDEAFVIILRFPS